MVRNIEGNKLFPKRFSQLYFPGNFLVIIINKAMMPTEANFFLSQRHAKR